MTEQLSAGVQPKNVAGAGRRPAVEWPNQLIAFALAFAVGVAAYTGFRVPNAWSATLDSISLGDGFHRRFLVGTLLRPLADAVNYNYWLFAMFSYLVLATLLVVLVALVFRTRLASRRFLIITWLLLPTGGSSSTKSAISNSFCTSSCSRACGWYGGID